MFERDRTDRPASFNTNSVVFFSWPLVEGQETESLSLSDSARRHRTASLSGRGTSIPTPVVTEGDTYTPIARTLSG